MEFLTTVIAAFVGTALYRLSEKLIIDFKERYENGKQIRHDRQFFVGEFVCMLTEKPFKNEMPDMLLQQLLDGSANVVQQLQPGGASEHSMLLSEHVGIIVANNIKKPFNNMWVISNIDGLNISDADKIYIKMKYGI